MHTASATITAQELRLKTFLRLLFFFYLGAIFLNLLPSITFVPGFLKPYSFINDAAFVNNSVIKMGLFTALCFMGAADVRKYLVAVEVMIFVMLLATLSGLLLFLFVKNNYWLQVGSKPIRIKTIILYSTI